MYINTNTFLVKGDLYTDMYLDPRLLERNDNNVTIHVKGDVHFGVLRPPKKLKDNDYYMDYSVFISTHGPIFDIIAFSKI
jgi:hypothetical protein